jgi:hypothetical protein
MLMPIFPLNLPLQLFMTHASPALAAMQAALGQGKGVYVHCAQVQKNHAFPVCDFVFDCRGRGDRDQFQLFWRT